MMAATLAGQRILVPRDGGLGDRLAAEVRGYGGEPVIAPIIEFREPVDVKAFTDACGRLAAGVYDWVAVTSATTVDALVAHDAVIPERTRVAVVGPATRDAMRSAGFRVDFMPATTFSAAAMVAEWPDRADRVGRVLLPQSAIAEPTLADGLAAAGLAVEAVAAYETVPVGWSDSIRQQAAEGRFAAVLLTSASVARAVAAQGISEQTVVACIGDSTASGARAAGLAVHAIAESSTADGLVAALASHHSTPSTKVDP